MLIKPTDNALHVRIGSSRPSAAAQPACMATGASGGISLSSTVRAYLAAVTGGLPFVSAPLHEFLTAEDRLLLAWAATEFVSAEGLDPGEIGKLASDLGAYRMQELAPEPAAPALSPALSADTLTAALEALGPGVEEPRADGPATAPTPLLALPTFTPRDESLARTILASMALRDTLLDRSFVRTLLHPDLKPAPTVDLGFLHRLVVTLSPAHADGALDPGVSFARRDAHSSLAQALSSLSLSAAELSTLAPEHLKHGAALLKTSALAPEASSDELPAAEPFRMLLRLTRADRTLLTLFYAAAHARGTSPRDVDAVARALVALREAERMPRAPEEASLPTAPALAPTAPALAPAAAAPAADALAAPDGARDAERVTMSPEERRATPLGREPAVGASERLPGRSFGSPSQIAAKLAESYGPHRRYGVEDALAPAHDIMRALGNAAASPTQPSQPRAAYSDGALGGTPLYVRPLELAHALGLGALVSELHARSLRARRARRRATAAGRFRGSVREVARLRGADEESDADTSLSDRSYPGRSSRWQWLLSRRRRWRRRRR